MYRYVCAHAHTHTQTFYVLVAHCIEENMKDNAGHTCSLHLLSSGNTSIIMCHAEWLKTIQQLHYEKENYTKQKKYSTYGNMKMTRCYFTLTDICMVIHSNIAQCS